MNLSSKLRKYLVMGSQNCKKDPLVILEEAIDGGITAFQYREKGPGSRSGKEKLDLGRKLREKCKENDILFFINDDLDLVEPLEADGIHIGQDDEDAEKVRALFPKKIIGLSVSNTEEVTNSFIDSVDYLGAGPIFSTNTKKDAKPIVGTAWITTLRKAYPDLPIVGIGGITTMNASEVIRAGADGVAVISDITHSKNISRTVKNL
ncbi:thiamine-phosphate diphosphorylase [Halobacillus mangrovi]|uniref:Thiamine-phosphate synthase n=2 Tax=Halobacillus mangrovi TaxID=402384 RepID=A0A1W6A0R3_9BACI|nr:thiamine-phosphate diphosphorylase [Halobacillus mangrovi]